MLKIIIYIVSLTFLFSFLLASNSTPNRQVDIHHTVIDISVDLFSEKVSGLSLIHI